ncbi:GtrA family protein [Parapedobacter sp. DT-150]|uniref:GtrA family protein n=1 Tax=Parapedobacter sp. DT-150 TaxID=3396162 RepID=UPI003F1DAC72
MQYKSIKYMVNGQVFRFILVGSVCAVVEFVLFTLLYTQFKIDYLVANVIAVVVAILLNYFLSREFVFQRSKYTMVTEIVSFISFSMAAVFLNQLILWCLVEKIHVDQVLWCKIIAILVVSAFNFLTKKYIVFHK